MAPPSRFGWPSLTAIFLLFLSLLNIATSSPLPEDNVNKTLVARTQTLITVERYQAYLKKYFPATDHYLFYSGGAEDQIKAFKAKNPGYYYYDDLFNAPNENHPWYKAFNEETDLDDGEASSKALALTASGEVLVFGAIEYKTAGANSFFTLQEVDNLHKGVQTSRITSINHMAKGATSPSQVMAKEDGNGVFTWQKGYQEGDKNASGAYGQCKRVLGACDAPKLKPKSKSGSGTCGTNGKRAEASNGACSMKTSSSTTSKSSATATSTTSKPSATTTSTTSKSSATTTSTKKSVSASATKTTKKAAPTTRV